MDFANVQVWLVGFSKMFTLGNINVNDWEQKRERVHHVILPATLQQKTSL